MKDRIGKSAFWNAPIRNKTQNRLERFERRPGGEWWGKEFKDSERKFKMTIQRALKTHYDMDDL